MIVNKTNVSNNVSIVLVSPEHPNNVGAVARAMNNMGISDLRLVNPCEFLNNGADGSKTLAVHSHSILENAKVFTSLKESILDKEIIIGTTNRIRGHHKQLNSIWELDSFLLNLNAPNKIAFVFGRETSGLSNQEINLCNHIISIPTFGENNSLNLSQAVMIILYEFSKFNYKNKVLKIIEEPIANSNHIEKLKENIFLILKKIDYIKNGNEDKKWGVFSKLISDKKLTTKEVDIIQGVLSKIKNLIPG
ncbi:RNA methyltransferase [Silvanigrella sp.]|uniref:RNA methyltransferase n=1 Tax=Silvanigrella sp. TaxID=2024976 RepID=UPI0037C620EE